MNVSSINSSFVDSTRNEFVTDQNSPMDVQCVHKTLKQNGSIQGNSSCEQVWDNLFCWPETPAGTAISEDCSVIFSTEYPAYAPFLQGKAYRSCLVNGTWADGNRTNYEECAISYEEYEKKSISEQQLVYTAQHILFFGSLLSLVTLALSLGIFRYFRGLRCDRVALLVQLMLALVLRFVVLLIITEPFVLSRAKSYRDVDLLCKLVILLHLFATVTSVSWMFVQGMYLNSKLTSPSFNENSRENFGFYHFVGWGLPVILTLVYLVTMLITRSDMKKKCWKGYADMPEIWILMGPMVLALLANGIFLVLILKILVQRIRRVSIHGCQSTQVIAAAKATLLLSPVLGVNNLLLLYNPGGEYEKYYVITNSLFGSTQGFFVALVFCFCNKEVQEALRRFYKRKLVTIQAPSTWLSIPLRNPRFHRSRDSITAETVI